MSYKVFEAEKVCLEPIVLVTAALTIAPLPSIKARSFLPESSNDASDCSDDRRRLQVGRRLVVAAGHQAAQVQGGEQRRRHQGEKRQVFLNEVAS